MIVCIAEKPSAAKDIAQIIGAKNRKDGYFEGNGYQVTWTFGHLCTLKEPKEYYTQWKHWRLEYLPMIPPRFGIKIIDNDGVKKQFQVIKNLLSNAQMVINCGDAGQEGELIQRWVMQKAQCTCPVKRLWISSLTEEAIREGFRSLKEEQEFDSLYEAGLARAIGDWLLGLNITRLYTIKYGNRESILSIGRVQTPTLALVVKRHLEIEKFVPTPFWELKTICRETTFTATKGRLSSKEEGEAILQEIDNQLLEITSITTQKSEEYPPRLFDLTSLQVECNKKLNLSAEETLNIVQSLYEKKLTTYPRVDTTYLSNDIYPKVRSILQGLTQYKEITSKILSQKSIPKPSKVFNNQKITDHHAIIPTGVETGALSNAEQNVFELIAKRFIAAFYPNCKISQTTINAKINNTPFKATGKQILLKGWREVFDDNQPNTNTDEENPQSKIIANFTKGEKLPHTPTLQEKQTQPPKYYTEGTLLRAMESSGKQVEDEDLRELLKENGIGRPSTRANIIQTLFKREYIKRVKKSIHATPKGIQLIKLIEHEILKSAELTGIWEKKLRMIEQRQYNTKMFLQELKELVSQIVQQVTQKPLQRTNQP